MVFASIWPPQVLLPPHGTDDETHDADQGGTDGPVGVYWGRYIGKPTMNGKLLGGFNHFSFSIIYGNILPNLTFICFRMVIAPPIRK